MSLLGGVSSFSYPSITFLAAWTIIARLQFACKLVFKQNLGHPDDALRSWIGLRDNREESFGAPVCPIHRKIHRMNMLNKFSFAPSQEDEGQKKTVKSTEGSCLWSYHVCRVNPVSSATMSVESQPAHHPQEPQSIVDRSILLVSSTTIRYHLLQRYDVRGGLSFVDRAGSGHAVSEGFGACG